MKILENKLILSIILFYGKFERKLKKINSYDNVPLEKR